MTAGERQPIGDRLERAIEDRVDVEHELQRAQAMEPSPRRLRRTAVLLAITAVSLYLVAPGLIDNLSSWRDVDELALGWLLAMAPLQAAALGCLWTVQRLAVHAAGWHAVATSQLAGNAIAKIAPGGGALGAALQYRMLVQAGVEPSRAVSGLTAANLLLLGVVLALPVLAIPAILGGSVDGGLVAAAVVAVAVFAALFAIATAMLALDAPLAWVGRAFERVRNRLARPTRGRADGEARRPREPLRGTADRLIGERDHLLATLGPNWREALAATVGRWAFDYGSLLVALAAVGSTPHVALVLLAFCTAQVLTQVPLTPGGLGFVEAGLTATLTLAGVPPGRAVLATFAYRLFTYWLPLPLGLLGAALHRRRYGS